MIVMKENEESCQLLFPSQIGLKSVAYIGERAATLRPSSALLAQWQVVPLRKNLCCIQDGGHHELVGHTVTDNYDDGSHSCRTWITMAVFRQIELSSLLCALGCRVWSWVRGGGGGGGQWGGGYIDWLMGFSQRFVSWDISAERALLSGSPV